MKIIKTSPSYSSTVYSCKVSDFKNISDSAFVITLEKPDFEFTAGQHVIVSLDGDIHDREYSICSSEEDEHMQILVKEVTDGYFTPLLKKIKIGTLLKVRGPQGRFCIDLINNSDKDIVLIATGTGIAPFRSMVFSYPDLNFRIIHGIQRSSETYFKNEFSCNYVSCTSQESSGDYSGRVTGYLKEVDFNKNSIFYLCGNFDMIYDVQNILSSKGHSLNSIFTEVYF